MKRLFAVFVLTPAEQRLVVFVVVLLVAGAWLKQQRDSRLSTSSPPLQTVPVAVSPSPNER